MITNERQYRITKAKAERFQSALVELRSPSSETRSIDARLARLEREAVESQLQDLRDELKEYEALTRGEVSSIAIDSFDELGEALIKGRIAGGLSQRDLAERLGIKEQQIQRYEVERYASASYERLKEVVRALGLQIREDVVLPEATGPRWQQLLRALRQAGVKTEFLVSRLLPSDLASQIEDGSVRTDDRSAAARASEVVRRIFGWTPSELLGATPPPLPRYAGAEARFKMPAGRAPAATGLYSAYANYLATVVLAAFRSSPASPIPTVPSAMREAVIHAYGQLTFRNALNLTWDLGIPVLPLRDTGAFHGACWRYERRNVIVLKQRSRHESRWLFDLLHELYHAGQDPGAEVLQVVEADETSAERRNSDEEIAASQFAGEVVLAGRADALAKECVTAAKKRVDRLKAVVPAVAEREGVGVGALANYLAFRLSWQGFNWWGAAENLQEDSDTDPWFVARDVFFERFTFGIESELDQQLLQRALEL